MDEDDMPDFTGMPMPSAPGTADDILDEADELEGLLEDALLEEQEAEEAARQQAETIAKSLATGALGVSPSQPSPEAVLGPTSAPIGASLIQTTTQHALESMPRTKAGLIDVDSLTPEQHRAYNAAIMAMLTEEQQDRYGSFRRSSLKEPMKRLIQVVCGTRPDAQSKTLIALSSVAKSFVGELIEEAKRVAESEEHTGPLQPAHVVEAFQRLRSMGLVESVDGGRQKLRL